MNFGRFLLAGNTSHLWNCETDVCSLCGVHKDKAPKSCPEGHKMADVTISGGDAIGAQTPGFLPTTGDAKGVS